LSLDLKRGSGGEADGGTETQSTVPGETAEDMDIDGLNAASTIDISPEREDRFNAAFSQYMMVNHLEQISMNGIGNVVNRGNTHDPFSQAEITCLLQRLQTANRLMIVDQVVHLV